MNSGGETNSTNRKLGLSFQNNWLYNHGRHTMNFGFEIRRSYQDDNECQQCGGQFTFNGITTSNGNTNTGDPLNENNTGSPFASFLLGTVDDASRQFAAENKLRNIYVAPYFQDDIKVTPKLTVNAGLRWDIARPFVNATPNNIVFFNPAAADTLAVSPASGQPLPGGTSLLGTCPACVGYDRASIHWREFSPRIGFAYQVNSKTVVLGGYSLNHLDGGAFEYGNNKVAVNYGNQLSGTYNVSSSGNTVPAGGNWDTTNIPVPPPTPFTPGLANGFSILYQFSKNAGGLPYISNYNVGHRARTAWQCAPFRVLCRQSRPAHSLVAQQSGPAQPVHPEPALPQQCAKLRARPTVYCARGTGSAAADEVWLLRGSVYPVCQFRQ